MFSPEVMHYVYLVAWTAATLNVLVIIANGILLRKIRKVREELGALLEEVKHYNKMARDQLEVLQFAAKHFSDPDEMERFLQENQVRH